MNIADSAVTSNVLTMDLGGDRIPKSFDKKILFVGTNGQAIIEKFLTFGYTGLSISSYVKAYYWLENQLLQRKELPTAIICDFELTDGNVYSFYSRISSNRYLSNIPLIVLAKNATREDKIKALKVGIDDFYDGEFNALSIHHRIDFLRKFKMDKRMIIPEKEDFKLNSLIPNFRMPWMKRLLDILVSATALIILSPLFLFVAILIKLESKGPIFYVSKRAGTGYQIFDFYKFRSMRVGADKELQKMKHMNQYGNSSFVKIENDPRITKIGNFLRNTSLDEIPQLFNVLKGDMSLVGNRPLPLYEAEQLTKDQWAKRFLAPAGITGLWQVTKRGKAGEMSEEERMQLDIDYADKSSFWFDLTIMLKTIPALIQEQKV